MNSKLWNSGNDKDKEIVRQRKRRLTYIANIYVVSDPAHPEKEGKVFLYKFGKKIFDKINEKMNPQFQDETLVNPFDMWEGADFKLKIRKVEGYRNYDKSEFSDPTPLSSEDDNIEAIWKTAHSLSDLIAPDKFKSYEDLQKRLQKVLAEPAGAGRKTEEDDVPFDRPMARPAATAAVGKVAAAKPIKKTEVDEDDDLDFFKKLAEDDQ
jgi:gp32 DNA binding protein like